MEFVKGNPIKKLIITDSMADSSADPVKIGLWVRAFGVFVRKLKSKYEKVKYVLYCDNLCTLF